MLKGEMPPLIKFIILNVTWYLSILCCIFEITMCSNEIVFTCQAIFIKAQARFQNVWQTIPEQVDFSKWLDEMQWKMTIKGVKWHISILYVTIWNDAFKNVSSQDVRNDFENSTIERIHHFLICIKINKQKCTWLHLIVSMKCVWSKLTPLRNLMINLWSKLWKSDGCIFRKIPESHFERWVSDCHRSVFDQAEQKRTPLEKGRPSPLHTTLKNLYNKVTVIAP